MGELQSTCSSSQVPYLVHVTEQLTSPDYHSPHRQVQSRSNQTAAVKMGDLVPERSCGKENDVELAEYEIVSPDSLLDGTSLVSTAHSTHPLQIDSALVYESDVYTSPQTQTSSDGGRFAHFIDSLLEHLAIACLTVTKFLNDHDPLTRTGRTRLRNTILRSGPAYVSCKSRHTKADKYEAVKRFSGWRLGALLTIALLIFCLLTEAGVLVAALSMNKKSTDSVYSGVLYQGSCDITKRWATIISLGLNAIATLTIGTSNYMMQCLSAPSGSEMRQAHRNGRSLTTALWWTIGLTSIPVHLLFNSAFFTSLQANNYAFAMVTADYIDPKIWRNCTDIQDKESMDNSWKSLVCSMVANATAEIDYQKMSPEECIRAYSQPLVTQHSNVLLVANITSDQRTENATNLQGSSQSSRWANMLSYTNNNSWQSGYSEYRDTNEPALGQMEGLFSVFLNLDYSSWDQGYARWHFGENRSFPSYDPSRWLCHEGWLQPCTEAAALKNASTWTVTPQNISVSSCLSQQTPGEHCKLEYSAYIIALIMICDVTKIMAACLALRLKDCPCITVGDALAQFLEKPDPHTLKRCLVDGARARFENGFFWMLSGNSSHDIRRGRTAATTWPEFFGPRAFTWNLQQRRWYQATGKLPWLVLWCMVLSIMAGGAALMHNGLQTLRIYGGGEIWTRGLASVDPNSIFPSTSFDSSSIGFWKQAVLVNTPQLLFSYLYFIYNGTFTAMHAASEWADFATERKSLRVSDPKPGQRSTYWLNLPWSYSIPLIAVSALLHWLVSRSLYLVRINILGPDGKLMPDRSIAACGFSVLMIMLVLALTLIMMATITGFAFLKLSPQIPVIGITSVSISAVCHHPNDPATEACKPLLWGVTRKPDTERGEPGHCSLSSEEVESPANGARYW